MTETTIEMRGALAGAVAAAVWALQQPVDKRVFGCAFDDVELLGKAVTRGPHWRAAGTAMHIANGALFGVLYARLAPRAARVPPWARGGAAALGEHMLSWPATAITDRFHPARHELPALHGSRRAFAQATWRHLLFGATLGELAHALEVRPRRGRGPIPPHRPGGARRWATTCWRTVAARWPRARRSTRPLR